MNEEQRHLVMVWSIRVLEPKLISIGPVVLKCYVNKPELEKIYEKTLSVKENLFETISKEVIKTKKEISKKAKSNSLVLIEVSGKGFAYKHGGKIEDAGEEKLLFPAPSKLIKIGVYQKGKLSWFKPKKGEEIYVYEGIIDVPEDVDFVVIDTDNGSHVLVVEKIMQSEEKNEETGNSQKQ
jgi:hypothetical protein